MLYCGLLLLKMLAEFAIFFFYSKCIECYAVLWSYYHTAIPAIFFAVLYVNSNIDPASTTATISVLQVLGLLLPLLLVTLQQWNTFYSYCLPNYYQNYSSTTTTIIFAPDNNNCFSNYIFAVNLSLS